MNAIYTRQSVDRADSISIESQIEFCKYEMRGEAYKVYTDRGYSGKNTDRPAFAEMMNDIENGIISKESPFGKAVLGKKVGDRVYVKVSPDYEYYVVIKSITKGQDDESIPLNGY